MSILTKNVLMGKDIVAGALSGELKVADLAGEAGGLGLDGALAAIISKIDASSVADAAALAAEAAIARAAESANAAAVAAEQTRALAAEAVQAGRIDAMLSGSSESLDQFVEVVAAYEAADGNLQSSISGLSTAASTDRALIRTEMATESGLRVAAENAIQADVDQNELDSDAAHAAATTDRALLRTEAGNESAARVAAEGVIAADLVAYETSNDAALAAVVAQHGADDGAAAAARLVLTNDLAAEVSRASAAEAANASGLAQEILDRAADVNAEEGRALAAESSMSTQMDLGNGFAVSSIAGDYKMGWGAGKPRMSFAIVGGVVTMSVDIA